MTTPKINIKADCRDMPPKQVASTILKNRGIDNELEFLHPKKANLIAVSKMKNMNDAVDMLLTFINVKGSIAVLADTDQDGIASGTIMTRYLWKMGVKPKVFINHGKKHGLHRDEDYWNELKSNVNLLIVVDSLDSTDEIYRELYDDGMRIIVLDHHNINPDVDYDSCVTLVSSMRDDYKNHELSGAGVTWKFCYAIDKKQKTKYADDLIDLAATGILADVMDVTAPENRWIIKKGLDNLTNPCLKRLTKGYEFNSTAVLFSCAPVVNACNRMDKNQLILDAFLCDDDKKLLKYNKVFKEIKDKQNEEVDEVISSIRGACEEQKDDSCILVTADYHHGIAGLVAMKISSEYQLPTIVVNMDGETLRGSQRSDGVNLNKIINESGLAISTGHDFASGVEVLADNWDKFYDYMKEHVPRERDEVTVDVDALVDVSDLTGFLADKIEEIQRINGNGFPQPVFMVEGVDDYEVSTWKDGKHLLVTPNKECTLINWNTNENIDEFEDGSLMSTPVSCIGTIQKAGFHGHCWMIARKIWLEDA